MTTEATTLACGCKRGEFLCETAERLWRTAWLTPRDEHELYLARYAKYEEHFNE